MKKFFVKNLCFCCGGGLYEVEKKTAVPITRKQPPVGHELGPKTNGNATSPKQTYVNGAYRADDAPTGGRVASKGKKEESPRPLRQISDISAFFRLPSPDEKSLSDMMLEEYDNKTRTLRGGEMGGIVFRASTSSSPDDSDEDSLSGEVIGGIESKQETSSLCDVTNPDKIQARRAAEVESSGNRKKRDHIEKARDQACNERASEVLPNKDSIAVHSPTEKNDEY